MRSSPENPLNHIVIFGGGGQFGRLFTRRLIDAGLTVHGVDITRGPGVTARQDEPAVIRLLSQADVVLLCIPEKDILAEIPFLAGHLRRGALLTEIASVKAHVARAAELALRDTGIEFLSFHPMFGPSVDFAGGNVVFIEPVQSPRAIAFKQLVESWGVVSHTMTTQEHDEATRITQVACHAAVLAFASAAASSGLSLETIRKVETPISRALLALGSRILSGDPGLYFAIQQNNGTPAREALIAQLTRLQNSVAKHDEASWNQQFQAAADLFGKQIDLYTTLANEMLKVCRQQ